MTFVPKEHNLLSHWMRSVYYLEKLDSVVYFLGERKGTLELTLA